MEQGWDPDVKKFLVKVLNSVALGLLWLMACSTAGLYYGLAYTDGKPVIYTILFYFGMALTLYLLLRHLYKKWK